MPVELEPPAADVGILRGQQISLRRVLINLLYNSIKAENAVIRDKHNPVRLEIRRDSHATFVFRVKDSGCGFKTAESNGTFKEGSGRGLALCRELCKIMGGQLELVKSEPDVETVFEVRVPSLPKMQ